MSVSTSRHRSRRRDAKQRILPSPANAEKPEAGQPRRRRCRLRASEKVWQLLIRPSMTHPYIGLVRTRIVLLLPEKNSSSTISLWFLSQENVNCKQAHLRLV